jgi:FkbM family methyltransferase
MTQTYVEYQFPFRNGTLKMAGRPTVESDSAIINMIFQREMFALGQWQQTKSLNQYFIEKSNKGLQPLLVDAGANIGAASLYFNQIYSGLKTIAIEPDMENAQLVRHNLAGLDAQVIQGALGREVGVMYINDIDFSPIAYRVGETVGNKPVESYTIPSILSSFDANYFPFLLKIDIEGGEDIVFSKDAPWLDLFPLVIIELHDWMLPFQNSSRSFYRNISVYNFDILSQGENTFCFNKRLLFNT